ncbi:hypothetical protein, partial [Methylobacter sp. BlB1]|uniref:hypothetical protein n=1 Tax=Methylobacter sp. BlB1 TaxID=2785914 RepID=UPI001E51C758
NKDDWFGGVSTDGRTGRLLFIDRVTRLFSKIIRDTEGLPKTIPLKLSIVLFVQVHKQIFLLTKRFL